MASLTDKSIKEVYKDLLHTSNSNTGLSSTIKQITCGDGDATALYLSTRNLKSQPVTDSTSATTLCDKDGNALLTVDSTNDVVKVNSGQQIANTQYAYFGVGDTGMGNILVDVHYAIPFKTFQTQGSVDIDFGTGTDPDTTFTTADTDTQWGSQLVPMMWFVPDNISIDGVTSIEGADANLSGGDATTRMHLLSYTFASGSTSALSSGTLLAHNSDVTNAGNEQAYLSTWTVDSASVAGGKVILAFFRTNNVNADYSLNLTIKYHLT